MQTTSSLYYVVVTTIVWYNTNYAQKNIYLAVGWWKASECRGMWKITIAWIWQKTHDEPNGGFNVSTHRNEVVSDCVRPDGRECRRETSPVRTHMQQILNKMGRNICSPPIHIHKWWHFGVKHDRTKTICVAHTRSRSRSHSHSHSRWYAPRQQQQLEQIIIILSPIKWNVLENWENNFIYDISCDRRNVQQYYHATMRR